MGLQALDELTWGLHPGQVCTIAARPAEGKSAFTLQIAWHLAKLGKRVLYISLEMSKEELIERLFSHEMRIDNQVLRRGRSSEVHNEMVSFVKILSQTPLYLIDARGYRMEEVEKIMEKQGFDSVFLDYLQLIKTGDNKKRNYEIGQYLRDFRRLAKTKQFTLVVLSQISRAAQDRVDRRPMLHELKDSGDIEQDSDTVMMLYWPANNEKKETDINKYEVIVAKQRYGRIGTAKIRFRPEHYSFTMY